MNIDMFVISVCNSSFFFLLALLDSSYVKKFHLWAVDGWISWVYDECTDEFSTKCQPLNVSKNKLSYCPLPASLSNKQPPVNKEFKAYCIFIEFSLRITKNGEMEKIFLTLGKNFSYMSFHHISYFKASLSKKWPSQMSLLLSDLP